MHVAGKPPVSPPSAGGSAQCDRRVPL